MESGDVHTLRTDLTQPSSATLFSLDRWRLRTSTVLFHLLLLTTSTPMERISFT